MPIVSPQIKQGKKNRDDFVSYLVSLLPQWDVPPPPGMQVTGPATVQDMGRPVIDMLVPQPEDTIMGLMKPTVRPNNPFFLRFTDTPKKDIKRGYSHLHVGDRNYMEELNSKVDSKYPIVNFGKEEYGLKLDGLNGFGPYESIEEAIRNKKMLIEEYGETFNRPLHVFQGRYLNDDEWGWPIFEPEKHIKKIHNKIQKKSDYIDSERYRLGEIENAKVNINWLIDRKLKPLPEKINELMKYENELPEEIARLRNYLQKR